MDYKIKPIRKYEEYEKYEEDCADNGMELLLDSIYSDFLVDEVEGADEDYDDDEDYSYSDFFNRQYNTYSYRKDLLQILDYSGAKEELAHTRLFNGNSKFEVEASNLPKIIEDTDIRDFFTELGGIYDFFDAVRNYDFKEENNISNFLQRRALHLTKEMVEESFAEHKGLNEYHFLKFATYAAINKSIYSAINKGLDTESEESTIIEKLMPESYHILISLMRCFEDVASFGTDTDLKGNNFKELHDSMADLSFTTRVIYDESYNGIDEIVFSNTNSNPYMATYRNIEDNFDKYLQLFRLYSEEERNMILGNRLYMLKLNEETGHIEKIYYVNLDTGTILQTINIADFQEEYNKLYKALVTLYVSTAVFYLDSESEEKIFSESDVKEELITKLAEKLNTPYKLILGRVEYTTETLEELGIDIFGTFKLSRTFDRLESTFSCFFEILASDSPSIPFKRQDRNYAVGLLEMQRNIKFDISDAEINKLNSINSLVKQIKFMMDTFRRKWLDADSLTAILYANYTTGYKTLKAKTILSRANSAHEAFKDLDVLNAKPILEEIIRVLKRKSNWQSDAMEKNFSRISSNVQYKDTIKWIFSLEAQDILTASVNDHEWSSCHASSYGNTPMALMSNGVTFVIYEEEGDKLLYDIDNKINRTYAHYKEEHRCLPNGEVKRTLVIEGTYPRHYNEMVQKTLINIIAEMTGDTNINIQYTEDAMFFGRDYDYSDDSDEDYEVPDDFMKCGYYDYFESNSQVGFQDGDRKEYPPTMIARCVPHLLDIYSEVPYYYYDNRTIYDCLFR